MITIEIITDTMNELNSTGFEIDGDEQPFRFENGEETVYMVHNDELISMETYLYLSSEGLL